MNAERARLEESRLRKQHWNRWGPFLSERAWGTVREDYSPGGTAWDYFPFDHAHRRAFRWNEDGIAGICDRHQYICFAIALWNGRDPVLKERLFGLGANEGNHGEDVKEYYFYLDNTPTHSYMKCLYKYPQAAFPYQQLRDENRRRTRRDPEYELLDTGVFREDRYFDVFVEYAKASPEDLSVRVQVFNRGPEAATLHLLPTIWFRNTWSWGYPVKRPVLYRGDAGLELDEPYYGKRYLYAEGDPELLFTENESDAQALWGQSNPTRYVKDAIGRYLVDGAHDTVNPAGRGTKAAAHYVLAIAPGTSQTVRLRFSDAPAAVDDQLFADRLREAGEFYREIEPHDLAPGACSVMRQAFAGLLWNKQFYHYVVRDWLQGDPAFPPPPPARKEGRNHEWGHLYNSDVISMPDKWEFPWYASWDLAFHCLPLALIDPEFAKSQLTLLTREWYLHPNGQLPAYEWALGDVNPPVHAWSAWRVYKIEQKRSGRADRKFLERVFHKLLLNFTWWVNRKDAHGMNVFEGGFLGLDNIGVLDRSAPMPTGEFLEQADGTGWMAMYCLNLLRIALELAREDSAYEDVASKFWEHFLYIARAMTNLGEDGVRMWDETDGFFYDALHLPDGRHKTLRIRSLVGLIPLFAVETIEPRQIDQFPGFRTRMQWFLENRPDLTCNVASMKVPGKGERRLLSIVNPDQLRRILHRTLDEQEFLSPYGVRGVSRAHRDHPFVLRVDDVEHRVDYEPGESRTELFGGNSNWRGPVWFPLNYLLIESLQKFHHYLGDEYKVECPTGSGNRMTLWEVAAELSRRLSGIFLPDANGRRAVNGGNPLFDSHPHWRDYVLFYEFFHGETGAGLGASHQTGWTGLVTKLLQQSGV
jgi:hypothetical protein